MTKRNTEAIKHKLHFRLLPILFAFVILFAFSIPVYAAQGNAVTKDGLTAQLFTDKDSYIAGEPVHATVQVSNQTGKEVYISGQISAPAGVTLANSGTNFEATLQSGEALTKSGTISSTATNVSVDTTATNDNMQVGSWITLTVLTTVGMLAIFIFGKNRITRLSIFLCLVMISGMVTAAIPVQAADVSGSIDVNCTIQVDGKNTEISATVDYLICDNAQEEPDTQGIPSDSNIDSSVPDSSENSNTGSAEDSNDSETNSSEGTGGSDNSDADSGDETGGSDTGSEDDSNDSGTDSEDDSESLLNIELLKDGSFEELVNDGTENWTLKAASVETEKVNSGSKALKVTETRDSWAMQAVEVVPGATYQLTGYMYISDKTGTAFSTQFKFEGYNDAGGSNDKSVKFSNYPVSTVINDSEEVRYENGDLEYNRWFLFTYIFKVPEEITVAKLYFRGTNGLGEAYFDDLSFSMIKAPEKLSIKINNNSYYTSETEGVAYLTPIAGLDTTNWYADCYVLNGSEELWSSKDIAFDSDGEISVSFDVSGCTDVNTTYTFKTVLYDDGIEIESDTWDFVKRYERPTHINENGLFINDDGSVFHPVLAYHMNVSTDWAEIERCVNQLGITVFQVSHGYVKREADWPALKEWLNKIDALGAKAMISLYNGNKICSDPSNKEAVEKYVAEFKDHPAIFAWAFEDEPVGGNTPQALIREAYDMLRKADPNHPVYTIDQREPYYATLIQNADVIAIDNYPYGANNAMEYIYSSAKYAVDFASDSNKPIYPVLQCWPRGTGQYMDPAVALYCPTGHAIRNMIYQSFLAGSIGYGFYGFDEVDSNNPTQPNMMYTDTADGIIEFAQKERDIMFEYFTEDKYPTFNSNIESDPDMRYFSFIKDDLLYMIVLNRHEFTAQTISVPLTGIVNGQTFTYDNYTALGYAGGAGNIIEQVTTGTLDVTLKPGAAAVYIIRQGEFAWFEDNGFDIEAGESEDDTENTALSGGLIANGDFETILTEGWTTVGKAVLDTTTTYSGKNALKLSESKGNYASQTINVLSGETYELTGYLYADTTGPQLEITQSENTENILDKIQFSKETPLINGSGTFTFENESRKYEPGKWIPFTYTFQIPDGVTSVTLSLRGRSGMTDSYFDALALVRKYDGGLISNGDFEITDPLFKDWVPTGFAALEADVNKVNYGNYSLRISNDNKSWASQIIEVTPGETYTLTGYMYMTDSTGPQIKFVDPATDAEYAKVQFSNLPNGDNALSYEGGVLKQNEWVKFSYIFKVPDDITNVKLLLSGRKNLTVSYFDDIALHEFDVNIEGDGNEGEGDSTEGNEGGSTDNNKGDSTEGSEPEISSLLLNGGFENLTENESSFENWTESGYIYIDKDYKNSGINSVRITGSGNSQINQSISVKPQTTYQLTGYMYATDPKGPQFKILNGDVQLDQVQLNGDKIGSGTLKGANSTDWEYKTGEWIKFSYTFEIPADITSITLSLSGRSGMETSYFDDVALHKADIRTEDDESESEDLLLNGDFESLTEDGLSFKNWTEGAKKVTVGTISHTGNHSVSLSKGNGYNVNQIITVTPEATYQLSGYVYLPDSLGAQFQFIDVTNDTNNQIVQVKFDGNSYNGLTLEPALETGKWIKFSYTYMNPEKVTSVKFSLLGTNSTEISYFDDLSLIKVNDTE